MLFVLPAFFIPKLSLLWIALALAAFAFHLWRKDYISLSVGIGAVITAFAVMFGYQSLLTQALVFGITSIVFMASFIPAMIEKGNQKHMLNQVKSFDLQGKTAVVTETIDNMQAKGHVKVNDQEYKARTSTGNIAQVGEEVIILDRDKDILIIKGN